MRLCLEIQGLGPRPGCDYSSPWTVLNLHVEGKPAGSLHLCPWDRNHMDLEKQNLAIPGVGLASAMTC